MLSVYTGAENAYLSKHNMHTYSEFGHSQAFKCCYFDLISPTITSVLVFWWQNPGWPCPVLAGPC